MLRMDVRSEQMLLFQKVSVQFISFTFGVTAV